jgi:hypothetical protein
MGQNDRRQHQRSLYGIAAALPIFQNKNRGILLIYHPQQEKSI